LGGTIEALLMERPTIATRVGGMPEAVRDQETGLLVPPGDAAALADAIEWLLRHPEASTRLGRAGRARMLRGYTLEQTGTALGDLYAEIAQAPR
jgi:glycosyltransferase involved in cell wall biosynthesis